MTNEVIKMKQTIFRKEDGDSEEFFNKNDVSIDDLVEQLHLTVHERNLFKDYIDGFHLYFKPDRDSHTELHYYSRSGDNLYRRIVVEYEERK